MFPLDGYPAHTSVTKMFPDHDDLHIIAYCAEEVRRQEDTQWHVFRMLDAWNYARNLAGEFAYPDKDHILEIGRRMDEANELGFREKPIWIGGQINLPLRIPERIEELLDGVDELSPDSFYYQFEIIHPFIDGNGRTGKVLYNWLNRSLNDPVWPRNFWGISNP